jgi:hypothetical protein
MLRGKEANRNRARSLGVAVMDEEELTELLNKG